MATMAMMATKTDGFSCEGGCTATGDDDEDASMTVGGECCGGGTEADADGFGDPATVGVGD